jgi:hypothetical protein
MRFSGHETFICKQFWLKKGYDFLQNGNKFGDEDAVVDLGVGKNMVSAIAFWMKAFGLCDDKWNLTEIAHFIFGENGKDKYIESIGTAWLLHYMLIKEQYASIYDLFFNGFRKARFDFTTAQLHGYLKVVSEENGVYNENTIKSDISVLQRMYQVPDNSDAKSEPEDVYSSIFNDIQLMVKFKRTDNKGITEIHRIPNLKRDNLPFEIVLFSMLDNYSNKQSISFKELETGANAPGVVFALNKIGLFEIIEKITLKYTNIRFSSTAGVQVLQFTSPLNKWDVIKDYYANY